MAPSTSPLTRALAGNLFRSRDAGLRAVLEAPDFKLLPETAEVLKDPRVLEVLTGRSERAEVTLRASLTQRERLLVAQKLALVADRTRLVTGQQLRVEYPPAGLERVTLTNATAREELPRLPDHYVPPPVSLQRAAAARAAEEGSTRVVSMVSYCASSPAVARFLETLELNERSLEQFGYFAARDGRRGEAMRIVIADDSPEPFASELREAVARLQDRSRIGAHYQVFGAKEKAAHFEAIWGRVASSPKLTSLGMPPEQVRGALRRQFSDGAQSGVGPNRNTSVLLGLEASRTLDSQGARGRTFQMDHDQTLQVLVEGAEEGLRFRRMIDQAPIPVARPGSSPVALPVDTLGVFEAHELDRGALAPATFSGAKDRDIPSMVYDFPELTEQGYFGRSTAVESWLEEPDKLSVARVTRPDETTRSALLMKDAETPWSLGGRNQDLYFGILNPTSKVGVAPFVLHRDLSGVKWGRAALLEDDMRSNAGAHLTNTLLAAARKDGEPGVEAVGRRMLAQLGTHDVAGEISHKVDRALSLARGFVQLAQRRQAELEQLQSALRSAEPGARADAAARWFYGRPLEDCSATKQAQASTAETQARALARLGEVERGLQEEVAQMRARFPVDGDAGELVQSVASSAREEAQALGLSYVFAPEIRGG